MHGAPRRLLVDAATLTLAALVDAAIVAVLVAVAAQLGRRRAAGDAGGAIRAFQVWWLGLAFTVLANALREVVAAAGVETSAPVVAALNALQYLWLAATCAAVAGLLYYLVYLHTGSRRWLGPLVAFYALYAIAAFAILARIQPDGVAPGKWFVQWAYARPDVGVGLLAVMSLLLLLPQIVGAAVYLTLRGRVAERGARYRIAMVAWPLLAWLGSALLAPAIQLGRFEAWQAGGRLVGLVASLLILAAYRPPAWIRARLGIERVPQPHEAVEADVAHRASSEKGLREAIQRRVRELV